MAATLQNEGFSISSSSSMKPAHKGKQITSTLYHTSTTWNDAPDASETNANTNAISPVFGAASSQQVPTPYAISSPYSEPSPVHQDPQTLSTSSASTAVAFRPPATYNSHSSPSTSGSEFANQGNDTAQTSTHNSNNKVDVGILAGAIVATAVGVALVAIVATALICLRRHKQTRRAAPGGFGYHHNKDEGLKTVKGAFVVGEKETSTHDQTVSLAAYLPQPKDDGTIGKSIKTLFNRIDLHVDNFYEKYGRQIDNDLKSRLNQIDSGELPQAAHELLAHSEFALPVLKHMIASLLISMSTPSRHSDAPLLPARLAEWPMKLEESNNARESQALRQAYSQWKTLNVFLYGSSGDNRSYQRDRERSLDTVVDLLTTSFAPWQSPSAAGADVRKNLRGLAQIAADIGILIISQASSYEFYWGRSSFAGQNITVFPGLRRTSDECGRELEEPHVLVPHERL